MTFSNGKIVKASEVLQLEEVEAPVLEAMPAEPDTDAAADVAAAEAAIAAAAAADFAAAIATEICARMLGLCNGRDNFGVLRSFGWSADGSLEMKH